MHPFPLLTRLCRPAAPGRRGCPGPLAAILLGAVLLLLFPLPDAAQADEGLLRAPRTRLRAEASAGDPAGVHRGVLEKIASAPVHFYQHYLGPLWGQRCAYPPSCSHYALEAIEKHGALIGAVMTFDRLQHEPDEARSAPQVVAGGVLKFYDPLANNDYWWYRADRFRPPAAADAETTKAP